MEFRTARPTHLERIVAAAVVVGLAVSIVAGVFLIDDSTAGDLPGIALGSETILVIERIAMLFATGLLVLVVVARALAGELPIEVSGRGVRYADAATAQGRFDESETAFKRVDDEIVALQDAIAAFEARQDLHAGLLRRYAMKGEGDDH